MQMLFECPGKVGQIFKTAGICCGRNTGTGFDQSPCFRTADQIDGVYYRHTGKCFELPG